MVHGLRCVAYNVYRPGGTRWNIILMNGCVLQRHSSNLISEIACGARPAVASAGGMNGDVVTACWWPRQSCFRVKLTQEVKWSVIRFRHRRVRLFMYIYFFFTSRSHKILSNVTRWHILFVVVYVWYNSLTANYKNNKIRICFVIDESSAKSVEPNKYVRY